MGVWDLCMCSWALLGVPFHVAVMMVSFVIACMWCCMYVCLHVCGVVCVVCVFLCYPPNFQGFNGDVRQFS